MRLTKFSDYALRALVFAASTNRLATIEETADIYAISRAHLKKVVMILTHAGFLKGVRGRLGGYTLARPPEEINLGAVLRATEADFQLVECFGPGNECRISRTCRLAGIANEALAAFMRTCWFATTFSSDRPPKSSRCAVPTCRPQAKPHSRACPAA